LIFALHMAAALAYPGQNNPLACQHRFLPSVRGFPPPWIVDEKLLVTGINQIVAR